MKLFAAYSDSHERLLNEWFLPTLEDEYDLQLHHCDAKGRGRFMENDWTEAVLFKSGLIIDAIKDNKGDILVYSDVDIQFFGLTRAVVLDAMINKDIVCQLDAPKGLLCTGFFAVRANDATLSLWEEVRHLVRSERRDQPAFNRLVREMDGIQYGCLPLQFFGAGTFYRKRWEKGQRIYIPANPLMFHANWTVGVDNKLDLHRQVRRIVGDGRMAIAGNNLMFFVRSGIKGPLSAANMSERYGAAQAMRSQSYARPTRVCLDASTVCQLKCPSCPTASGAISRSIGGGLLSLDNFTSFIREHPWIKEIELSNWGEILLNPDLTGILEYAYEHAVAVKASNGVNLNAASDEMLEALVKYRMKRLTCSIDGASQETYSLYRRKGNYDRVIENIQTINAYKRQYDTNLPVLRWQFVVFGHNEHEIADARRTAKRLGMKFAVKLSWDDLYTETFSPVEDGEIVKKESGLGVSDRRAYERKFGRNYAAKTCAQLWEQPRINYDGRLLGCSINHWGDYGNVFEDGLEACLNGERMVYAKQMLRGEWRPRNDIPCSRCKIYESMRKNDTWVKLPSGNTGDGLVPARLKMQYAERRWWHKLRRLAVSMLNGAHSHFRH